MKQLCKIYIVLFVLFIPSVYSFGQMVVSTPEITPAIATMTSTIATVLTTIEETNNKINQMMYLMNDTITSAIDAPKNLIGMLKGYYSDMRDMYEDVVDTGERLGAYDEELEEISDVDWDNISPIHAASLKNELDDLENRFLYDKQKFVNNLQKATHIAGKRNRQIAEADSGSHLKNMNVKLGLLISQQEDLRRIMIHQTEEKLLNEQIQQVEKQSDEIQHREVWGDGVYSYDLYRRTTDEPIPERYGEYTEQHDAFIHGLLKEQE